MSRRILRTRKNTTAIRAPGQRGADSSFLGSLISAWGMKAQAGNGNGTASKGHTSLYGLGDTFSAGMRDRPIQPRRFRPRPRRFRHSRIDHPSPRTDAGPLHRFPSRGLYVINPRLGQEGPCGGMGMEPHLKSVHPCTDLVILQRPSQSPHGCGAFAPFPRPGPLRHLSPPRARRPRLGMEPHLKAVNSVRTW